MEVFNLFSRFIPQQGLARIESHRQRQGLIPDLKIVIPVGGQPRSVLHEIKVISCSQSRYKPSWEERAVDKRAGVLHQEYLVKARTADQLYVGTNVGVVGPVERKLLSYDRVQGLVFGAFGEASEPVHRLIDQLADSRVTVAGPQRGRKGVERAVEGERALVVGQIRRKISVAAARAQAGSLLGRLEGLGPGMGQAVGRRQEVLERNQLWTKERHIHTQALHQSHIILRQGFAKTD